MLSTSFAPIAIFITFIALIGLVVGSFLNVLIYRTPLILEETQDISLSQPRSYCPHCHHPLTLRDNIPLLSFVCLKGRCRYCAHTIDKRYPLVELGSALISGALAWRFGPSLQLAGALVLGWGLLALAWIDYANLLLPDRLTLPLLWVGLGMNVARIFTSPQAAVSGAILGYGLLWGTFQLFRLVTGKEGIGHGDFKLLAVLGAWLGYQALPAILLISSASAIAVQHIFCRRTKYQYFAFGPYLCFAGLIMLFSEISLQ